jgi:hypothetical protein
MGAVYANLTAVATLSEAFRLRSWDKSRQRRLAEMNSFE